MSNVSVKIKKLKESAVIPKYAHSTDVGFDLVSVEDYFLQPGSVVTVSTGLSLELPDDFEVQVRPRSGLSAKTGLKAILGTIDPAYRGELKVIIQNTGDRYERISIGDRIAQGVIAPIYRASFDLVEQLNETDRPGGFGSSGLK